MHALFAPESELGQLLRLVRGGTPAGRGVPLAAARRYRRREMHWLDAPGVVGYGLGLRRAGGRQVAEPCLSVLVAEKRPRRSLELPIPTSLTAPGIDRPLPIDVVAVGAMRPHSGGGSGIRNGGDGARQHGTLGCVMRRANEPQVRYVLSNAHVLAPLRSTDDNIYLFDTGSGNQGDRIGRLTTHVRYDFGGGFPNLIDAALAEIVAPSSIDNAIPDLGPTGISGVALPGMKVHLHGATSGAQTSTIAIVHADIAVSANFPGGDGQRLGFHDQVICFDFTEPGDSGSVVVNNRGRALGLHFWGGEPGGQFDVDGKVSIFSPFATVMKVLRQRIPDLMLDTVPDDVDLSGRVPVAGGATAGSSRPSGASAVEPPPVGSEATAVDVLARTLWGEARNQPDEGIWAVAEVIYNRAMRQLSRFGRSIEAVCERPSQFSCWNAGDVNRPKLLAVTAARDARFRFCLDVAAAVVAGKLTDFTDRADHYHHRSILPDWAVANGRQRQSSAEIGDHVFYNNIP